MKSHVGGKDRPASRPVHLERVNIMLEACQTTMGRGVTNHCSVGEREDAGSQARSGPTYHLTVRAAVPSSGACSKKRIPALHIPLIPYIAQLQTPIASHSNPPPASTSNIHHPPLYLRPHLPTQHLKPDIPSIHLLPPLHLQSLSYRGANFFPQGTLSLIMYFLGFLCAPAEPSISTR